MCSNSIPTTYPWKDRLDFARACSSKEPSDRCWLITEVPAWNQVLWGLSYELVEFHPGRLILRYVWHGAVDKRRKTAAREAAFLISWLVEHHGGCINELYLSCTSRPEDTSSEQAPIPIRLRPPSGQSNVCSIRGFGIRLCADTAPHESSHCFLPEEEIEAILGLEELKIFSSDGSLEPGLIKLLRRNSTSLKSVEVVDTKLSRRIVGALHGLDKCESMTVAMCTHQDDGFLSADPDTQLVQGLASVKKFRYIVNTKQNISVVAQAIRTNVTLTALQLYIGKCSSSLKDLFAALEMNTSLQSLLICSRNVIDASCGPALASALSKNTCLHQLGLAGDIADICLVRLAEALSKNTALEILDFTGAVVRVHGVLALCGALRNNTTLKKIVFPLFSASRGDRLALAGKLAHDDGYNRVLLSLSDPDLLVLSARLVSHASWPEQLGKLDICNISDAQLNALFNALASSTRVRAISALIGENTRGKATALCEMLRVNRSIRSIDIFMQRDKGQLIPKILSAMEANESIRELSVASLVLAVETASAMSDFFARNRRITKFKLTVLELVSDQVVQELARGFSLNPVIVELKIPETCMSRRTRSAIFDMLWRNRGVLNRAFDFVVLRAKDRRCAEGFELFSEKPCFLDHLMKNSELTECEALLAKASARNFLLDNYLVITGIVKTSLSCHPTSDGSTQCDKLNAECWRAIVRHLKIADVLQQ